MTNNEKGIFLKLFNRGGYVLDFSSADFDNFTMASVGVELCTKYGLSKGKSLNAFVNEASDDLSNKLLLDLLEYYETQYPNFERERDGINDTFSYGISNDVYAKYYAQCKGVAQRINSNQFSSFAANSVKEAFSSEYINKQMSIMLDNQETNPTESIGKAKELIESCCETILEKSGITPDKDWKLNQLVDETMKLLEITHKHIPDTAKEAGAIKGILGSLKGIATQIAIIRNAFGSGHGKSASYKGLQERHAKLAIGSSITLVNFLWDSFERKSDKA
ncbi:MAG: abortive infection family protein [Bacteroidales bacterium]|nr:abortive infection family protein [Bacteroidales bacterium]